MSKITILIIIMIASAFFVLLVESIPKLLVFAKMFSLVLGIISLLSNWDRVLPILRQAPYLLKTIMQKLYTFAHDIIANHPSEFVESIRTLVQ